MPTWRAVIVQVVLGEPFNATLALPVVKEIGGKHRGLLLTTNRFIEQLSAACPALKKTTFLRRIQAASRGRQQDTVSSRDLLSLLRSINGIGRKATCVHLVCLAVMQRVLKEEGFDMVRYRFVFFRHSVANLTAPCFACFLLLNRCTFECAGCPKPRLSAL